MSSLSGLRPEVLAGLGLLTMLAAEIHPVLATDLVPLTAGEIVQELAALGSRESGSAANDRARALLEKTVHERCGADPEVTLQEPSPTVEVRWKGQADSEIVLAAHYDTLPDSNGVADNASGCGVILASACDLSRSPRYRSLRAVFFDGEEESLRGSRGWLAARKTTSAPEIDAAITAELVGLSSALGRVVYPVRSGNRRSGTITPAWLIFAALQAAQALDLQLAVADARWPIFSQLALRIATPTRISDSRTFAVAGIPALTLSDVSMTERTPMDRSDDGLDLVDARRLSRWVQLMSAIVLQVDRVRHERLTDDEYLVALDRVWIRRDLLWLGLALWAPMVFHGLPGRWRGASSDSRRRRGRSYLPGFAFRMLFLLCMLLIPTLSSVLVYPAALVSFAPNPKGSTARRWLAATSFLPVIAFSMWIAAAQINGFLVLQRESVMPTVLILATLTAFWLWRVGHRPFHLA